MDRIESIILRSLTKNEQYTRRVLPFISENFFLNKTEKFIFKTIHSFVEKYNALPTRESLAIEAIDSTSLDQTQLDEINSYVTALCDSKETEPHIDWLIQHTESWCQEKGIHNAVLEVIDILENKGNKQEKGAIPKLLQDALGISFDPSVGHDYLEEGESRYDFYQKKENKIPFHLDYFNKVTKNGIPNKTLNCILAGTGTGKSLFMCDLAAHYLTQGKNVLYITMEMAEERIAERIDANLMDVVLDELRFISKDHYEKRLNRIRENTSGKLIIKEYPTASAHAGHFRSLLNELSLKKNFHSNVIFVDYLNICTSNRTKMGGGMYEYVKAIAEELRGLAVEFNVPIWTATQLNRAGMNNNDPDLTNTSESFGLPATCDFMFALVSDEKLAQLNQLMVKILKNRYADVMLKDKDTGSIINKFVIGVDKSKMKLYNVDDSAQDLTDMNLDGNLPANLDVMFDIDRTANDAKVYSSRRNEMRERKQLKT